MTTFKVLLTNLVEFEAKNFIAINNWRISMEIINDLKNSKAGERNSMLIYILWLHLLRFLFRNETIEGEIMYIYNNL